MKNKIVSLLTAIVLTAATLDAQTTKQVKQMAYDD